mmetsp:Transcript_9944/g.26316  ORF Transcript_9944/g.26316 Transcript_9944/m.26316 type:complete len:398 (+) Transcript_9944:124-1317(+)
MPAAAGVVDCLLNTGGFHLAAVRSRTAFTSHEVTCGTNQVCVSLISYFGKDHAIGQEVAHTRSDSASAGQDTLYEWGCPKKDKWAYDGYTAGDHWNECSGDSCLCVGGSSTNSKQFSNDGVQTSRGLYLVEPEGGRSARAHESKKHVNIVEHVVAVGTLLADIHPENPHIGTGPLHDDTAFFPSRLFKKRISRLASVLQASLDVAKEYLDNDFDKLNQIRTQVREPGALCSSENGGMTLPATYAMLARVEKTQLLRRSCRETRESMFTVAPLEEQRFPNKIMGKSDLNCYMDNGTGTCQMLNCYDGYDNMDFIQKLNDSVALLQSCKAKMEADMERRAQTLDEELAPQGNGRQETREVRAQAFPCLFTCKADCAQRCVRGRRGRRRCAAAAPERNFL